MRLYLGYALDQRRRFVGANGVRNFLNAFRLSSVPQGEMLAAARPAGPCQGYPNADTWIDKPMAEGVVLVGDAAGHNDPTIGQGLSIAFRDVRILRDALADNRRWTSDIFVSYAEEPQHRMHQTANLRPGVLEIPLRVYRRGKSPTPHGLRSPRG